MEIGNKRHVLPRERKRSTPKRPLLIRGSSVTRNRRSFLWWETKDLLSAYICKNQETRPILMSGIAG